MTDDRPPSAGPTRTLSEADSASLVAAAGVPVVERRVATDVDSAVTAAEELGFPVVVKLGGDAIAHKTERNLVRLRLESAAAVHAAATELLAAAQPEDGPVHLMVAAMLSASRELIVGAGTDPQFGPTVIVGVGGVAAEALGDVAIRPAPVDSVEAHAMIDELRTQALLGAFRGEPAIDRDALVETLIAVGRLAASTPEIVSIDLNPMLVVGGRPVAVDALVEVDAVAEAATLGTARTDTLPVASAMPVRLDENLRGFDALFSPRGVIVAGASTHPGKFGFVSLHNILAAGFPGAVGATNRDGATVLGIDTVRDVDDLPDGTYDLVIVCTPAAANIELIRACAARGVRAAFVTSAGYGEAGSAGAVAEAELVEACRDAGVLLAGPNGQGVVSTPAALCAQIVAPYPPAGPIGVASQSGNFVSSFMNWSCATGVGISRAVSAGNAAAVGVADYLSYFAEDPATTVGLAYLEGIPEGTGRGLAERLAAITPRMPVVVLKGGSTSGGARAASSHTGALATDDRVADGVFAQCGVVRADTVESAFEAAATFATQPLPTGNRVVVMTTAGGWGVVTADAISRSPHLELLAMPDDLRAAIDEHLPPRWSRNNPVDLAGGETRDTIPIVMRLIAEHPDVDAIVYLGLGIQSNQARLMRDGPFYPGDGLDRIVAYHERQDARFAQAAADISADTGKPILTATELAVADPANAGPAAVRASGRVCYSSADRAVASLEQLVRYRRWLVAHGHEGPATA